MTHEELSLNSYQRRALNTCMLTCNNFAYMFLNLVGEVGEFASHVAKAIRKGQAGFGEDNRLYCDANFTKSHIMEKSGATILHPELMAEAGDILWQLAGLCATMGWELEDVAQYNLSKLKSRKERGVIDGNGDNR